jgi:hypothetical protein
MYCVSSIIHRWNKISKVDPAGHGIDRLQSQSYSLPSTSHRFPYHFNGSGDADANLHIPFSRNTIATCHPSCTDNLAFLEDITIPNGTVVVPGESVDKRWLVQNSGSCNWDDRYRLKFVSGSELSAPLE